MMTVATARWTMLAAGVLFSTGGAAIKACESLTGPEIAALRSLIGAITILALLPEARRRPDRRVVLVSFAYAATLSLVAMANKLTTAANVVFLQSTAPLYVVLLGPLLLRERIARRDLVVLALIGIGMAAFFVASEAPTATASDPATGITLAAASGFTWALTVIGLRALGRGGENAAAQAAALGNLLAFAINLPAVSWQRVASAGALDWAMLGWLGVFQVGVAYALISRAVRFVPAFAATLLLMTEPAFNPVWAWLVHGEVPSTLALLGGAVICGALVGKAWLEARLAARST